jgi:hypothetical protein
MHYLRDSLCTHIVCSLFRCFVFTVQILCVHSAQPPNLEDRDFLSGFTLLGGLTAPRLKSPACPIVVVGHTSSGSSARACPAGVTLPVAYAPAGLAPSFRGTRNPPTTERWCPMGVKMLLLLLLLLL